MTLPTYGADLHRLALTWMRLLPSDDQLRFTGGFHVASNNYRERVARAALLIDWAANGRLIDTTDAVEIDTSPSGSRGADALLAAIKRKPGRPLEYWLGARVPVMRGLACGLVESGVWQPVRGRLWRWYRDSRTWELGPLRNPLSGTLQSGANEPEMIALKMLTQLVAVYPKIIVPELIEHYRTRQLAWILKVVRDEFERELPNFILGPGVAPNAGPFNPGGP